MALFLALLAGGAPFADWLTSAAAGFPPVHRPAIPGSYDMNDHHENARSLRLLLA